MKRYDEDFKKKMIRLHLEEGRSKKSLEEEYNIGNGTIGNWIKEYNKECLAVPEKQAEKDYFAKTLKLEKENEELKKEVLFLKKAAAFFAKRERVAQYEFIHEYNKLFGLRWLLNKFKMYPNAYYNYLKNRKKQYKNREKRIKKTIKRIYHKLNGIPGYHMMKYLLEDKKIFISFNTSYKYMKELGLRSITRRKYIYKKGNINKVFPNLLKRNFMADSLNQKWCTDFTYIALSNGQTVYNCSILDLYDRRIVASMNGIDITSELVIRTLKTALLKSGSPKNVILHSDQGSQFTSKEFTLFCEENNIIQSMSHAGCPYDNAPMERFFNTMKSEFIYHYYFKTFKQLNNYLLDYIFIWYNSLRPHTSNGGKTPYEIFKAA